MYESYFGFKEKPFNITPDPRFLYLSKTHREALAQLIYGVKERKGFVVLSGEVGTGKTTIVRALLERLDENCQVAYIFNTKLPVTDFLKYVSHDFGLQVDGASKIDYLINLHDFLIESHTDGKTSTLIVDEAQNLDAPLFEEIRMLTNLETSSQKLLQIILVGQPELNENLENADLWQLKQRISTRYHLLPLDSQETREYMHTRMRVAGAKRLNCFTEGAIQKIYQYSRGIPRLINNICDNSLLVGYAMDAPIINEKIVRECVADLKLEQVPKNHRPHRKTKADRQVRYSFNYASLVIILIGLLAAGTILFLLGKFSVPQRLLRPFGPDQSFSQKSQETDARDVGIEHTEKIMEEKENIEPESQSETGLPADSLTVETVPPKELLGKSVEGLRKTEVLQIPADPESPRTRIAIAREGESISEIIFREFGRFDVQFLPIVQNLNPEIEDLNQIDVGQKIRLPLDFEAANENQETPRMSALTMREEAEPSDEQLGGMYNNKQTSWEAEEFARDSTPDIEPSSLSNEPFRVVTFQKGDTISSILIQEFGRVDVHLLEAVKKLNPEIEDINQIVIGQEIRLPLDPREAYRNPGSPSYFSIHVASFKRFDKANQLFNKLIEIGEKPTIIIVNINGNAWYRVTVGEYKDFAKASSIAKKLVNTGRFTYAKPLKIPNIKQAETGETAIN